MDLWNDGYISVSLSAHSTPLFVEYLVPELQFWLYLVADVVERYKV